MECAEVSVGQSVDSEKKDLLDALAEAVRLAGPVPVVAIGGLTSPERARQARMAGAAGVAVLTGVAGRQDMEAAARAFARACGVSTET